MVFVEGIQTPLQWSLSILPISSLFPLPFAFLYFILDTGSHYVAPGWPGACYVDQTVPVSEMKGMHHHIHVPLRPAFSTSSKYMHPFVPLLVCMRVCVNICTCVSGCAYLSICGGHKGVSGGLCCHFPPSLNLGLPQTRTCVSATLESCKTQ